jgi:hypothetical protein
VGRPPIEVADIFAANADAFLKANGDTVSSAKRRVLRDLIACRTAALGGHLERCDECGIERPAYNSCLNRHCPKCQGAARSEWLKARAADLLPVEYFHVVFTLPRPIAEIALQNKKVMYDVLLRASAETLNQIARDPKHLGAQLGILSVLHTWGQTLQHHPHVHCVVPGGGLSLDGQRWIPCPRGFFLPVKVLSKVFRGKFLDFTERAFAKGDLQFQGSLAHLNRAECFVSHLRSACTSDWVVYSKPPFGGPQQVLKYLARYTHRVAISNHRIISFTDNRVQFRWKDYTHGNRLRVMSLDAPEFVRRFLLHVLPRRFPRIRYYGFLTNQSRREKVALCRELIDDVGSTRDISQLPAETDDKDHKRCPICQTGRMIRILELPAEPNRRRSRAPPHIPELVDTS